MNKPRLTSLDTDASLKGWWTFDGKTTNTVSGVTSFLDQSGNSNTATTSASVTTTGKLGQASTYSASKSVVADSSSLGATTGLTLSAWVMPTVAVQANKGIIAKWNSQGGDSSNSYALVTKNDTSGKVAFATNIGSITTLNGATAMPVGQWTHVLATHDTASGVENIYINGILDTTQTIGTTNIVTGTSPVWIGSYSGANNFTGKVDDARIYNRALSASEIQKLYRKGATALKLNLPPRRALLSGLTNYWTFDGKDMNATQALDRGTTTLNANLTGTTRVSGKLGQALKFNGTSDRIVSNATAQNFSDISVAFWAKPDAIQPANVQIIEQEELTGSDANTEGGWAIAQATANTNQYTFFWSYVANNDTSNGSSFTLKPNKWNHVVVTKSGATATYYVNGVKGASGDGASATILYKVAKKIDMGFWYYSTNRFWNGVLDDVQIYNRALTAAEAYQLYRQAGITVNTPPRESTSSRNGLVGWWTFNGKDMDTTGVYDMSGNGRSGTRTGTIALTGKIGQGLLFNDTKDEYVTIPNNSVWNFSGAFSISAWIKTTSNPAVAACCSGVVTRSSNAPYPWYLRFQSGLVEFAIDATNPAQYTWTPTPGRWYHLVGLWDGSNNKVYVDGVQQASVANTSAPTANSDPVYIGLDNVAGVSKTFPGIIDDVRIYNRALSVNDIQKLYRSGQ